MAPDTPELCLKKGGTGRIIMRGPLNLGKQIGRGLRLKGSSYEDFLLSLQIEEIVEGILQWLNSQLEPSTKEETLQAMCSLAGSNTHTMVPMLLNKPLPWDRYLSTAQGHSLQLTSSPPHPPQTQNENYCSRVLSVSLLSV